METTAPYWKNLVRRHTNYYGKIVDFCRIHNIKGEIGSGSTENFKDQVNCHYFSTHVECVVRIRRVHSAK